VRILDTSGLTDLEVEESGFKIKIAKKVKTVSVNSQPQISQSVSPDPDLSDINIKINSKSESDEEAGKKFSMSSILLLSALFTGHLLRMLMIM